MTIEQLIGRFRTERFQDATPTMALGWLNDTWRELSVMSPLRATSSTIVTVQNQQQYDLPAGVTNIQEVYYESSSGVLRTLIEENTAQLSLREPGWRASASGTPMYYFRDSVSDSTGAETVIGLYPKPASAVAGGFPRIVVYGSGAADFTYTDTVPTNIISAQVLLDGMSEKAAKTLARDQLGYWQQVYKQTRLENAIFAKEGGPDATTQVQPYVPSSRTI